MNPAEQIPWFHGAEREQRWLVGVSGGADSVALLRLLVEAGFRDLVVCHLHHGLRGEAADADAEFVRSLAMELGLEHELGREDVAARMVADGESLETAARAARHEFFAKCAVKFHCEQVLLAHHADDQAETILWNLLRGSQGLRGMRETQKLATPSGVELEITRPLLALRRTDLVAWLVEHGHAWREDASNAEPIAVRNRLRNEALPLLAEISQRDVTAAFLRAAADTTEADALAEWVLAGVRILDPQGRMFLPVLRELPPVLQRLALRNFLTAHGISSLDRCLIDRCLSLQEIENPAAVNLPGGGRMRRREGRLWIERTRP